MTADSRSTYAGTGPVIVALAVWASQVVEVRLSPCDRAACAPAVAGGTAWGRWPRSATAPAWRAPAARGAVMVACRRVGRDRPDGRVRRRAWVTNSVVVADAGGV